MKKKYTLKSKRKEYGIQNFTSSQFFAVINFNESQRALFQGDSNVSDILK